LCTPQTTTASACIEFSVYEQLWFWNLATACLFPTSLFMPRIHDDLLMLQYGRSFEPFYTQKEVIIVAIMA